VRDVSQADMSGIFCVSENEGNSTMPPQICGVLQRGSTDRGSTGINFGWSKLSSPMNCTERNPKDHVLSENNMLNAFVY
jgi:hypothetical protein